MKHTFATGWVERIWPIFRKSRRPQVAALCLRHSPSGATEVLLITSRDTGRWIIPKGWPMDGMSDAEAAAQEAWEEAGVEVATVDATPVGSFDYDKGLKDGASTPVRATVFRADVKGMCDDFPEAAQRKRAWFAPATAARLVAEPQLRDLLVSLDHQQR
ncbi:NUDIX hydrolase [Sulfitobacter sp. S190]|uniref:NUDIX hydrolase n=1 Tax=Sulfitobacter sp. S190 TaxID=2867022 RepID=UPI0021A61DEE|nr:NUDIX hydrolase [Sulfitobacter sp. S190]UWR21634.1 NUDIX hydrolase [Sulfitobacter sp. S190]